MQFQLPFSFGMRGIAVAAGGFAILVALLILLLGARYDQETGRFVAEGQLAEGRFLWESPGSCVSRDCTPGYVHVEYDVDGVTYTTTMMVPTSRSDAEPLFPATRIPVPRLGPERPYQVVYLPMDPATSRLRVDLSESPAAIYGTSGMFGLIGLAFVALGLFVIPRQI